ncbi:MAG TPA: hypothetical protein VGA78_10260 [Gemmatimonadales bacterium]|jgi:hypothetical protein
MKAISALIAILTTFLIGLGIVFGAPDIDDRVRVVLGLGISAALALLVRGPIGRAIGDQLHGGGSGQLESRLVGQLEEFGAELQGVRDELLQLNERLDFTERLLTRQEEQRSNPPALREGRHR